MPCPRSVQGRYGEKEPVIEIVLYLAIRQILERAAPMIARAVRTVRVAVMSAVLAEGTDVVLACMKER